MPKHRYWIPISKDKGLIAVIFTFHAGDGRNGHWNLHIVGGAVFKKESALRRNQQRILWIIDCCTSQINYRTLRNQKKYKPVALLSHTPQALHLLDLAVLSYLRKISKGWLNSELLIVTRTRIDAFNLWNFPAMAYRNSITLWNIVAGFKRTALWVQLLQSSDITQIQLSDFTT